MVVWDTTKPDGLASLITDDQPRRKLDTSKYVRKVLAV